MQPRSPSSTVSRRNFLRGVAAASLALPAIAPRSSLGGPGGCVFHGSEGKLRIDRGHLSSEPEGIVKEPLGEKDVHLFRSPGHHRNWLDCIRSREKTVAGVEAGARTATIIHLGNLAYWHRRELRWDPEKWSFVDDPEADTWRDRDRRDPWRLPG